MRPLIQLTQISKIYGEGETQVNALFGVNLTIEKGEFAAIVGHSGSGKSTLMNLLGCLDLPGEGGYLLDGCPIDTLHDKALSQIRGRQIGFIFQGFHLIPGLSALENVELPLFYRGVPRVQRRKMAIESLRKVGLASRIAHKPNQLSGGQQQRVAIARAIAGKPPLILADEPTGNLDSHSSEQVMQLLSDLWHQGHTVIVITHDPAIAAQAKRIIRIHDGKIIEDTKPIC